MCEGAPGKRLTDCEYMRPEIRVTSASAACAMTASELLLRCSKLYFLTYNTITVTKRDLGIDGKIL
jgi:hypothetical protein